MAEETCQELVALMAERGINVAQLADRSGVSERNLWEWRAKGRRRPNWKHVYEVSKVLRVAPEVLRSILQRGAESLVRRVESAGGESASPDEAAARRSTAAWVRVAVSKLFSRTALGHGTLETAMVPTQDLDDRVRKAHSGQRNRPLLTLVGGYAGSGKSEFGKALARVTGWAVIDKDVTARPMTEQLLVARGGDPNDRHSELYLNHVRPLEYQSTMEAVCRSLECKVSTVVTAPFLRELVDENWCSRLIHRCSSLGADVTFVWVDCDLPTMHEHIQRRGAARDAWKLAHWDEYEATVDVSMRPCVPHLVVDNRYNAAICLADQAATLAEQAGGSGQT